MSGTRVHAWQVFLPLHTWLLSHLDPLHEAGGGSSTGSGTWWGAHITSAPDCWKAGTYPSCVLTEDRKEVDDQPGISIRPATSLTN